MASVKITGASMRLGEVLAVDDLTMEINSGEFIALLGPSGSGKSTVLKMIAGLLTPTSGKVTIEGERNISAVFQNSALLPHSVYSNIALSLKIDKFIKHTKADIDQRVREAAALLEIDGVLERNCMELSGGQRQRVALARAFVRRPEVFLMDEPLASLDSLLKKNMIKLIKSLHCTLKTTFIYITHDKNEAIKLGGRIAVLNNGKLIQFDSPENIINNPINEFVKEFMSD